MNNFILIKSLNVFFSYINKFKKYYCNNIKIKFFLIFIITNI